MPYNNIKLKPKLNSKVVVWHDGELKNGIITEINDVKNFGWGSGGIEYHFRVLTKRKLNNQYTENNKYVDCTLLANSFTYKPPMDANFEWANAKGEGSRCFVFDTKEEYNDFMKNELKYDIARLKKAVELRESALEKYIDVELIEL
jgi:hypothetical protein